MLDEEIQKVGPIRVEILENFLLLLLHNIADHASEVASEHQVERGLLLQEANELLKEEELIAVDALSFVDCHSCRGLFIVGLHLALFVVGNIERLELFFSDGLLVEQALFLAGLLFLLLFFFRLILFFLLFLLLL